MANVCTGLIWNLDGEGFLISKPIWVRKAVLYPNAAGDSATFTYWGPESANASARATMLRKTVTTTLGTTITSTGNFEASEVLANDIINITYSSTGNNLGYWQVGTRSSDNAIIVDTSLAGFGRSGGTLTNEASKTYDWVTWAPTTAFKLLSAGTEIIPVEMDFGDKGYRFPNLAMNALSSSATVLLYLR